MNQSSENRENTTSRRRIADFYSRWFSRSWLILLFAQILLITSLIAILLLFGAKNGFWTTFAWAITAFTIIESLLFYIFLKKILLPLDVVARALSRIRGEHSLLEPVDPYEARFARNGIREILLTIHELNEKNSAQETASPDAKKRDFDDEILRTLPVGFIALDAQNNVLAANDLAPRIFREGNNCTIELDFSDSDISLCEWVKNMRETSISAEKFWNGVANKPRGEDERRIFDLMARYTHDAANGIEVLLVTADRTEFYEKREENADFITLAAHELRAPLTVIRGYLEILSDDLGENISPSQQEILDRLQVSSRRLSSYIGNILNTSRFDQNRMRLKLKETRPIDLVREVQDDMTLRAQTFGRKITFDIPADLPTVAADRTSLAEVLSNLIDNAIKYSRPDGEVEIFANRDGDFVRFFVRDHGVGMSPSTVEHLFRKFYRSQHSRDAAIGFGIGLYVSRAIVESHGGQIGVDSEENVGSTFNFTLPIFAKISQYLDANNENVSLISEENARAIISNHGSLKN